MSDDHDDDSRDSHSASGDVAQLVPQDEAVATRIEEIPAADGADVLEDLSPADAADVAEYLDPDTAGRIFSEMDPAAAAQVITGMEAPEASMVLASMDPDDRVDILEYLSDNVHDAIVQEFSPEDRADVQLLEQYPPDTAGGIMTTQVTSLHEDLTAAQAIEELRRLNEEYEQMFYVYVVDHRRHLIGVLSMRDLILSRPERRLHQFMRTEVARVPTLMDQEQVARLIKRYKYLALPVVDDHNRLVGLITVDDIVDVIQEEATEDVQKMFGAGAEERLTSPWSFSFRKRVGWLEVNLFTAFLAAWVIAQFDAVIAAVPILAAWQTVVSGMGGNAGAQAMAVAIRGIALGEGDRRRLWRVVGREAIIGATTGVVIGVTAALFAGIGIFGSRAAHPWVLGGVVFSALVVNQFVACVSGVAIPFAMKWLGFDPAQSATIFATTITDCCGFFATLGIAKLCMRWLTSA